MDQEYRHILNLQNRTSDWLDDTSAASARALISEIQKLEDETQNKKNPQSLVGRVRSVIHLLQRTAEENVMDHHHVDELIDQFEELERQFKKI